MPSSSAAAAEDAPLPLLPLLLLLLLLSSAGASREAPRVPWRRVDTFLFEAEEEEEEEEEAEGRGGPSIGGITAWYFEPTRLLSCVGDARRSNLLLAIPWSAGVDASSTPLPSAPLSSSDG
jgi:hypothetical protein